MRAFSLLLFGAAALSCSPSSHWHFDAIEADSFSSQRLLYRNPQGPVPISLELVQMDEDLRAFVSLSHFQLTPCAQNRQCVKTKLKVGDETFEEFSPVLEGRMRTRLSSEMTARLIEALLRGEKAAIYLDHFELELDAEGFAPLHKRLGERAPFWQTILKGPVS